jgi:hypothetical protein
MEAGDVSGGRTTQNVCTTLPAERCQADASGRPLLPASQQISTLPTAIPVSP